MTVDTILKETKQSQTNDVRPEGMFGKVPAPFPYNTHMMMMMMNQQKWCKIE